LPEHLPDNLVDEKLGILMRITGLYVEECVKHGLAGAVPLQIGGAKCVGYY
jgi:hypothetical protein